MIVFNPGDIAVALADDECRYGGHPAWLIKAFPGGLTVGGEYLVLSVGPVDDIVKVYDRTAIDAMRFAGTSGLYCCGCFTKKRPASDPSCEHVDERVPLHV